MSKPAKHPRRALVVNLVLATVAFSLLGWVLWKNRLSISLVLARKFEPSMFALAFGFLMLGLALSFVRWFLLVRVIDSAFRFRDSALLGFIGNVYNLVIPGAVGGDLIKAAFLVKMRINTTKAIASMFLDRILGLLGLFLLAGIAGLLAWSVAPVSVHRLTVIVWGCILAGFLGLAVVFAQGLTRRYPSLLTRHGRISTILAELRTMSETYRRRLDVVFGALLLSMIVHSLNVIAFYTMSRMMFPMGLPSLAEHFLMVPLTLFTTAVPLPFGALGLTEEVSEQLFKLVHHPEGALAMLGFRVLMYAGAFVSGCVYLANLRQVRSLTDTAHHIEEELSGESGAESGDSLGPETPEIPPAEPA